MRARINSHDEKNDKAEDLRFLQSVEPATPIPSNPVNLERTNARRFLSLSLPFFLSQLGRRTKLLVRWPSAGISLVGGNQEAGRKKNRAKKKKERKRERERVGWIVKSPLPRVEKTVPTERTWPIMRARERAFLRGIQRGSPRVAAASTLTRAAQLENRAVHLSRRGDEVRRRWEQSSMTIGMKVLATCFLDIVLDKCN